MAVVAYVTRRESPSKCPAIRLLSVRAEEERKRDRDGRGKADQTCFQPHRKPSSIIGKGPQQTLI